MASTAGPDESCTEAPLSTSVAARCTGIAAFSSSRYGRWRSMRRRRARGSTKDADLKSKPTSWRNVTAKTSRRLSPRQMLSSRATPSAVGSPAKYAPLRAPTDEPTTKSGLTPWATNSRSIPTWIAPKLPPPASTNAVVPEVPFDIEAYLARRRLSSHPVPAHHESGRLRTELVSSQPATRFNTQRLHPVTKQTDSTCSPSGRRTEKY